MPRLDFFNLALFGHYIKEYIIFGDNTDSTIMSLYHTFAGGMRKLAARYGSLQGASFKRDQHVHRRLLRIEPLEVRTLLSTYTVTNTADSGAGSLRQAITDANNNAGLDTIAFQIQAAGVQTISPTSALPNITSPVLIDGYTQSGSSVNTLAVGDNAVLQIELNGTLAGSSNALTLNTNGNTIRGLVIDHWGQSGIYATGSSGSNTITGCFIGTNADGTAASGNSAEGIYFYSYSSNNLVGGATPSARNVISCNTGADVWMIQGSGNTLQGNYIGTNAAGTAALTDGADGVLSVCDSSTNTITGNVISGHTRYGLCLEGGPNWSNTVQGNFIGTDATGTAKLGNASAGIYVTSGGNTIGGTTAAAANVISGNGSGILITTSAAMNNSVQGNYIGTNSAGSSSLGNTGNGIRVEYNSNTIGGTAAGAGNTIAYNGGDGVLIISAAPVMQSKGITSIPTPGWASIWAATGLRPTTRATATRALTTCKTSPS